MQLNKNQIRAIEAKGNNLTLAGAGSGKTAVITHRITRLLSEGVAPHNILALTFTNKSAANMRERLQAMHPDGAEVTMSTFHSYSARFLRPLAEWVGRTEGYTIFTDTDQKGIIRRITKTVEFQQLSGSSYFENSTFINAVNNLKDRSLDMILEPEDLHPNAPITPAERFALEAYEDILATNNAMDFGDLVRYANAIMMNDPDTRPSISHILVDEYQDTNSGQYNLLLQIAEKSESVQAVGDLDQSIYEWRSAVPENMNHFIKQFDAEVIRLEENYRSTPNIILAANHLIENNANRLEKTMRPVNEEGEKVLINHCDDSGHEAEQIARVCADHIAKNPKIQIGILYRQNRYSRKLETALRTQNIAYYLHKGIEFTKRQEVALGLACIRFASNGRDGEALAKILQHFGKGVGEKAIIKVQESMKMLTLDEIRAGAPADAIGGKKAEEVRRVITLFSQLATLPLNQVRKWFSRNHLETTIATFGNEPEAVRNDRNSNLQELWTWIEEFSKKHPNATASDFVQECSLDSSTVNNPEDCNVHLMTVHSSKGLEFDTVFIAGSVDGMFPGNYESEREFEEARRLFYVAMTRAKQHLFISVPEVTYLDRAVNIPSRFISEILESYKRDIRIT